MSEDLALRKKAIERIEALENAVKALLQAQKTREIEDNNEDMPAGEYYGIKFD